MKLGMSQNKIKQEAGDSRIMAIEMSTLTVNRLLDVRTDRNEPQLYGGSSSVIVKYTRKPHARELESHTKTLSKANQAKLRVFVSILIEIGIGHVVNIFRDKRAHIEKVSSACLVSGILHNIQMWVHHNDELHVH
jgi:hypothetical protein